MAFKDKNKEKEYKSKYDKDFKIQHRKEWNDYQKNYKVRKRFEAVAQIKDDVRQLEITHDEESLCFKAAVILFIVLKGTKKDWAIAYRTGYSLTDVKIIFKNWVGNGIYQEGKIIMENYETDLEFIMQVTLISMAGVGEIKRISIEKQF
jgi:hypothetical protein